MVQGTANAPAGYLVRTPTVLSTGQICFSAENPKPKSRTRDLAPMADDDETDTTPWQFYWKRPEYWETATTPLFSATHTRVVDHAAAVATTIDNTEKEVLLAVTLIGEHHGIGDRVVVSLTDPTTKECLSSRTLQWPTSEDTSSSRATDEQQLMSPFAHREVISCAGDAAGPLLQTLGVLFNKPDLVVAAASSERNLHSSSFVIPPNPTSQERDDEDNSEEGDDNDASPFRRSRGRSRRMHGLVAASLLRLASPTQTAEQSEAMEVLQFLSLAVPSPPIEPTSSSKETTESSSPRELVLALLTSTGQVHIYNPMELLDEEASRRHQNDLPDMENAMTHFIFGDDLVHTLQSHILPLSQPSKTLQVTVVQNSGSSSNKNNNQWDPTVERNTLAFLEPGGPWMAHSLVNITGGGGVAVVANNEYTGAVTFVSSSSWTEKRTLFFPSPIRLAHSVSWGPLSLLVLVLEEELVVAVAVSSTTVVAGKVPGETSMTVTTPTEQQQNIVSIARYQILLLEVPILSAQNEVVIVQNDEKNTASTTPSCVVSTKYQQSQYVWTSIETTRAKPDSFFYYNGDATPMVVIHTQLERQARLSSSKRTRGSFLGEGYGIAGNCNNNSKALHYIGWEGRSYVHELATIQFQQVAPVMPKWSIASSSSSEEEEETSATVIPTTEEDIVQEAIVSISQQAFHQKTTTATAPNNRSTFTLREKARRLSKSVRCDPNPYTDARAVTSVVTTDGTLGWVSIRSAPTPAPLLPVAAWLLHERQDYRTAASITLQTAGATDSLHQLLWKVNEEEQNDTLLEGLHTDDVTPGDVADFAVASLIAGHFSFTLEEFLERNKAYHPGRACLQLAAASARAVDRSEADLWPVRCLLTVGKTRDFLPTALQLLNRTLPQELRDGSSVCCGLVSWIVSAGALELLLDLTDEKSRQRYWKSIEPSTRRSLAVLNIDDRFPLLADPEIRQWHLDELAQCVTDEVATSHSEEPLSTEWLEKLIRACFQNAGCEVDLLNASDDGNDTVETTREGLLPAPGSGGLDFSLVIPALLVLERRQHRLAGLQPTRAILNAACYLAGRRNLEEPRHSLNSTVLMRQCTVVDDVEAGANLIGGKNGLILECCHVLIVEIGLSMDEAEAYLLSGETELPRDNRDVIDAFTIGPSHQRLLRLLREHVLSIRTYGEFETTHMRGRVDPVFAASICLKTWWSITSETLPEAAEWIVDWLEAELHMENGSTSPYRLVCAALTRALIWPDSSEGSSDDLLASKMKLRPLFLIQLSQSCCGLVESLPPYVTDNGWTSSPSNRKVADLNESFVTASGSFQEDGVVLFSRE